MELIKIRTKSEPVIFPIPDYEINLSKLPSDIGVKKSIDGKIQRWYHQEEGKDIIKWMLDQLLNESNVLITGSVPPWLGTLIGWHFERHPFCRSLWIRASDDKAYMMIGNKCEDGLYEHSY